MYEKYTSGQHMNLVAVNLIVVMKTIDCSIIVKYCSYVHTLPMKMNDQ